MPESPAPVFVYGSSSTNALAIVDQLTKVGFVGNTGAVCIAVTDITQTILIKINLIRVRLRWLL